MKLAHVTVRNGAKVRKGVTEVSQVDTSKKALIRKDIEDARGDVYDIVADALKWNSVLTTLISRMYDAMPEAQKATMDVNDRALIEGMFASFAATNTRADKQMLAEGGDTMIGKLMAREAAVGELF